MTTASAQVQVHSWDWFIERYYNDPALFVREIIGAVPTREQEILLRSLVSDKLVSCRSGHGIGKTTALAWLIHWFIRTRWKPKIPVTAPTGQQLYDNLWAELSKWNDAMEWPFRREYDLSQTRLTNKVHPKEWFAVARTARKEVPEALSGYHAEFLMFVIEEASGVPDAIFHPILGGLTSKMNYCVMVSNPIRNTGFFYDSHHVDRKMWTTLHFDSEKAERVVADYPEMMARKFGRESNIYRVRVHGDFPTKEADQLVDLTWCEMAAIRTGKEYLTGRKVWGLDVARFGDAETVLAKRWGDKVFPLEVTRNRDTMNVVGWVIAQFNEADEANRPSSINVDSIGIGAGVLDRLIEQGLPAVGVETSRAASDPNKFLNLRAELWWEFAEWLRDGKGILPNDEDLIGQSSGVRYSYASSGKIQVESKDSLRSRGRPSPDRADAVVLTFFNDNLIFGM